MRRLLCLLLLLALLVPSLARAGNTFGGASPVDEMQQYLGAALQAYIQPGTTCAPSVPGSGLTLSAFACTVFVTDSSSPPKLKPVVQTSHAVGPVSCASGTCWLAMHQDTSTTVSGWTRQAGTHVLWQNSATQPSDPANGLVFEKLTVSGGNITAVERVAMTSPSRNRASIDVEDFRACDTGAACDTAAIQAAINYWERRQASSETLGGGVTFSRSDYSIASPGIVVHYGGISQQRGIFLEGRAPGSTRLVATANNVVVLRWSASFGGASNLQLHGGGFTGTTCLRIAPEDETQTSTVVYQQRNTFRDMTAYNCTDGLVLKPGPNVSGTTGGAWDNEFYNFSAYFNTRCIYLAEGPVTGLQNGNNHRNKWYGGKCGGANVTNTGFHIRAGGENRIFGMMFENITTGTSPIATPTAIYVENNDGLTPSVTNYDNLFVGIGGENFTRALNNSGIGTGIIGWPGNNPPLVNYGSTRPYLQLTQSGASNQYLLDEFYAPTAESGLLTLAKNLQKHQAMLNQPYDGVAGHQRAHWFDQITDGTDGGKWHAYTPAAGDVTNVAGGAGFPTVSSGVWRFSGQVTWYIRAQFQASVAGNAVTIRLPYAPDDAFFTTASGGLAAWQFASCNVKGAAAAIGYQVGALTGSSTNTFVSLGAPAGNWDTAAANNSLWCEIRYVVPQYIQ